MKPSSWSIGTVGSTVGRGTFISGASDEVRDLPQFGVIILLALVGVVGAVVVVVDVFVVLDVEEK
jgi:hypothetical protein